MKFSEELAFAPNPDVITLKKVVAILDAATAFFILKLREI